MCFLYYNSFQMLSFIIYRHHQKTKSRSPSASQHRMNEVSIISTIKPRILGLEILFRERKTKYKTKKKLKFRINVRKILGFFYSKTTVVNNAELSFLSGYWSGVPCQIRILHVTQFRKPRFLLSFKWRFYWHFG